MNWSIPVVCIFIYSERTKLACCELRGARCACLRALRFFSYDVVTVLYRYRMYYATLLGPRVLLEGVLYTVEIRSESPESRVPSAERRVQGPESGVSYLYIRVSVLVIKYPSTGIVLLHYCKETKSRSGIRLIPKTESSNSDGKILSLQHRTEACWLE